MNEMQIGERVEYPNTICQNIELLDTQTDIPFISQDGDLFSIIHRSQFREFFRDNLSENDNFHSVEDWVCSFKTSSTGPVFRPDEIKKRGNGQFLLSIDKIRLSCVSYIEAKILKCCMLNGLPNEGVILIYPDDLSSCYLGTYSTIGASVNLEISFRIPNPKAFLSIEDAAKISSIRGRNIAKSAIQSGHKLAFHCGVLTHVDRRLEPRVFGPTIDTLILGGLAASYARRSHLNNIMEIGVGSGHIICCVAVNTKDDIELIGVDIEPQAIECTTRNFVNFNSDTQRSIRSNFCVGKFDSTLFNRNFDLIISNPPYIMERGRRSRKLVRTMHTDATVGNSVVADMFKSIPNMLNDNGQALFMLSSTTIEWDSLIPEGFSATPALTSKIEVPFEVETVLDDQDWLDELVDCNALTRSGDSYFHELRPIWLRRSK